MFTMSYFLHDLKRCFLPCMTAVLFGYYCRSEHKEGILLFKLKLVSIIVLFHIVSIMRQVHALKFKTSEFSKGMILKKKGIVALFPLLILQQPA